MALNIKARLGMDGSGFQNGLNKAKSGVQSLKASATNAFKGMGAAMAGAFAIAGITSAIRDTIDWAATVRDMASTWGLSTEAVQKFQYAADQSGTSMETILKGFKDLGKAQAEGNLGMSKRIDAFAHFGISAQKLKGMRVEEIFMEISRAMQDMPQTLDAETILALQDTLGGSGIKMVHMMRSNMDEMMARMEELGVVEDATIQKMGVMADKMEEFKTRNRGTWAEMIGFMQNSWMGFVDFLTSSIDVLAERLVGLRDKAGLAKDLWNTPIGSLFEEEGQVQFGSGVMELVGNKDIAEDFKTFAADKDASMWTQFKRGAGLGVRALKDKIPIVGGIGAGKDVAEKMRGKENEAEVAAAAKAEEKEKQQAQAKVDAVVQQRADIAGKLAELDEAELARNFANMSKREQLHELELKRNLEMMNLANMEPAHTKEDMDEAVKDLDTLDAETKRAAMEQENLDRINQENVTREAKEKADAKLDEVLKEETPKAEKATEVDLVGKAQFDSLARIGGSVGGRNPVLDTAKKQLSETVAVKEAAVSTAHSLSILSGVKK